MADISKTITARLSRAKLHRDAALEECRIFVERDGAFSKQAHADGNKTTTTFAIRIPQPPVIIGAIVGDCIHNLRSILDNIAWHFVCKSGVVLTPKEERKVSFPITPDLSNFIGQSKYRLKGIGDQRVIDLFAACQPFQRGFEAIRVLNNLIEIDKHRNLLLTTALINRMAFCIGNAPDGTPIYLDVVRCNKAGQEMPTEPPVRVNAETDTHVSCLVCFNEPSLERYDVVASLGILINLIEGTVVPMFEPHF